jgi:hypothetical protein
VVKSRLFNVYELFGEMRNQSDNPLKNGEKIIKPQDIGVKSAKCNSVNNLEMEFQ